MATDSRKRPGRGFSSTARGAVISRFIKKHFDVRTLTSVDRGCDGVRVTQEPYSAEVCVYVALPDEKQAEEWAREIMTKLVGADYEISWSRGNTFTVTKPEWKLDDMIAKGMFAIRPATMESDSGLVAALPSHIEQLRRNGWIKPSALELTELGEQVRARLLDQKRKREQAERRRIRERGW